MLEGPTLSEAPQAPPVAAAQPVASDEPLPINLATALYLSNARPLVIAFAQAAVEQSAAQLQFARTMWLPNINIGTDYYFHDGAIQRARGPIVFDARNAFTAGTGGTIVFGVTDAIFAPLAARQVLTSRQWDVQSARNDAMLNVAVAYFDVQQSRGQLAGTLDGAVKGEALEKTIRGLAPGWVPLMEIDRARTLLFGLRDQVEAARGAWRVASANLTRQLRLNPGSVVVPQEPAQLQVTLISPDEGIDNLMPLALANRPELSSRSALVQAALARVREERFRPWLPNAVLAGGSGPGEPYNMSLFGGGLNDGPRAWGGRFDMDMGLVWTLQNFGLGNRALIRQRTAEQQLAAIDFLNTQDQVAQDVAQALAQVRAAASQVRDAAVQVQEAVVAYRGNVAGLREPRRIGNINVLIVRPQEAVAALQMLVQAYNSYYAAVNEYNRAQFRLYRALGCPSRILASQRPLGEIKPVDMNRPPEMAPVGPSVVASPEG